jgi:tripartite-type tricarboxylate transporter receptor subunit TctC
MRSDCRKRLEKVQGRRQVLAGMALTAFGFATAAPQARAQADAAAQFPSRAVRIVVPFPPGGSTDITARLVAARLAKIWQQPVTVDNKPGAAANIGTEHVAHAEPDGHTMLLATTALPISVATFDRLGYDAVRDFIPVMLVSTIPSVLVVNPTLPVRTIQEFVAYAKSHPGKLNFASPGAATGQRLTFELLKQRLGIDLVHVPYKGGAPAGQAVVAGEVETMIMNIAEALPMVQASRLRALAVTTRQRAPQLPDVPTIDETVLRGIDSSVWQGVLVPAGTPAAVVERVSAGWRQALAEGEVGGRLEDMGMRVVASAPEDFRLFLATEIAQWTQVARTGNIRAE